MKHTYLHDVLPFLRELEREKQKQFEAYFRTAPLWLMDLFQSEIMEAGTTFIRVSLPSFQERSMRNGFIQIRKLFAWRQSLPVLPCWRKSGGTVCTCFWKGLTD